MAEILLQHCQAVVIHGPAPPPHDVTLSLAVGGSPTDGTVEVTAGPGQLPGPLVVTTGSSGDYPLSGITLLKLHYHKSSTGPDTCPVTYEVS